MNRLTVLIIGALIANIQAAYAPSAPIQWMSRVVIPQMSAGPFRGSTSPQLLLIKDPPNKISRDKVPHFTLNSDSSITLEGTDSCIEATSANSGSVARLNRCTGEPAQKWNWIPDNHGGSHIQLKDTDKCLDASIEGSFNGAPIVLWECESKGTEAWKFEEVVLKQGQYMVINLSMLAGVAALSLGALLWQYTGPLKLVPVPGGTTSTVDEGGVSLSSVLPVQITAIPGSASQRHRDVVMTSGEDNVPTRVEVCTRRYCKQKGSMKTLALLQELAQGRDDVIVSASDMSHTEHGCFDECTMGPNVRLGGEPRTDDGRVYNGVKGEDACAELLQKVSDTP